MFPACGREGMRSSQPEAESLWLRLTELSDSPTADCGGRHAQIKFVEIHAIL